MGTPRPLPSDFVGRAPPGGPLTPSERQESPGLRQSPRPAHRTVAPAGLHGGGASNLALAARGSARPRSSSSQSPAPSSDLRGPVRGPTRGRLQLSRSAGNQRRAAPRGSLRHVSAFSGAPSPPQGSRPEGGSSHCPNRGTSAARASPILLSGRAAAVLAECRAAPSLGSPARMERQAASPRVRRHGTGACGRV
ncbi:hypothetical protein NDU88_000869 [Pleurodeles waltl]|uniref:Uncharacterized protein n=1 Tax=Pleurodeles waltl TaxID=8319 RepID=A0AAV7V9B5_PLEWA|nr:hypothetical protein NDU88_000869 [Pleurodeles waltl]